MNPGVYSLVTTGRNLELHLASLSNNLANVNTTAYKADSVAFRDVLLETRTQAGRMGTGGANGMPVVAFEGVPDIQTNFAPAPLRTTGNELDVGLSADGFFKVETPEGVRYTRNGSFHLSNDNTLVDGLGNPVLGQGGARIVIQGAHVAISIGGDIQVDGALMGRLQVVDFEKPYTLEKAGSCYYRAPEGEGAQELPVENPGVEQGSLEIANVSAVRSMTEMVALSRNFEACQKFIRSFDEVTSRSISELGRVS